MKRMFVIITLFSCIVANAQITGEMEACYIEAWNLYLDGLRDKDNNKLKQAFEKMKVSANQGHPFAQHELARDYDSGVGCSVNLQEAYKWMYASATNPNWRKLTEEQMKFWNDYSQGDSYFFLGIYCMEGMGTTKDYERAIKYWTEGSQYHGHYQKNCFLQLAFFYERGWGGLPKNPNKAVEMFQKASDLGDADAAFYLAVYYANGDGGLQQSKQKAFNYTKLSAERGYSKAIFAMGTIYEGGEFGQLRNMEKAIEWYILAAKKNYADAIVRLSELGVNWK